ncbi:hypothetical protein D922_02691 [Enterococcus faecalis 06-MB-DW-09]|nr:hypothetical protein D922_02691 [Enterococcus faecalis 06-MB-DW-09]
MAILYANELEVKHLGKTKSKGKKKDRRLQAKAEANGTLNKKKLKTPDFSGKDTDPSKAC